MQHGSRATICMPEFASDLPAQCPQVAAACGPETSNEACTLATQIRSLLGFPCVVHAFTTIAIQVRLLLVFSCVMHAVISTLMPSIAGVGANGNGPKTGSSGNLQVMGSMAFGLGTSAVGSPGFGQFLGPGPNPSSLVSSAAMNPQLGGDQTLFSRQEAVPSGENQQPGSYHPFGSSGGLNVGLHNNGLNQGMQPVMHHPCT